MKSPLARCAVLGAVIVWPASAALAATPDATELISLQSAVRSAAVVRVTDVGGVQMLRDVWLDSSGLKSARWGPGGKHRPAVVVDLESMPPPPQMTDWKMISSIEVGSRRTWKVGLGFAAVGAALGLLYSGFSYLALENSTRSKGDVAVMIGVPAAVGFAAGAVIGHDSFSWKTVYPSEAWSSR